MRPRPVGLLVAIAWLAAASAQAHITSVGLVTLDATDAGIAYRLRLSPDDLSVDLAAALMRAAAGDTVVTGRLTEAMHRAVKLHAGDQPCQPAQSGIAWLPTPKRLELQMTFRCAAAGAALTLAEDWHDLLGEHHHNIVRVRRGDETLEYVLGPDMREARLDLTVPAGRWWDGIARGVGHALARLTDLF